MEKEVILENENITIWYYNSSKIVHHQIHKFTQGKEFRDALNAVAGTFETKGAVKYLSDDRKNAAFSREDAEWLRTVWRPRVTGTGWKYWAIVLPDENAGRMVMETIISDYFYLGITLQLFVNPEEALKWLESQ
ncbi:MAG: hypothetical protein JXN64_03130 [Spirochaetes bacterium]|nr:hypothetical protein [Spirochaetota bacterium]